MNPYFIWEIHNILENQQKHCQFGFKRIEYWIKGCQTPKVIQTRNSLIKLLSYKYMLTFMKKTQTCQQNLESRRQNYKLQIITTRPLNQMAFAWMDFETAGDLWLLFCLNVCNSYSMFVPIIVFWKAVNLFLQVHRLRNSVSGWITQSLAHTWVRQWDLEYLSWWDLDEILDGELML